jgi:hypothetical protein
MGDVKTIRYLCCAYQVVHINPPTHGSNSMSVEFDYNLSQ